jgi:glucosamine-6-phosphate deaminase
MEVIVKDSYEHMSALAAEMIAEVVRRKPRGVLGLPTGSTPLGAYRELIRMHKEEDLDFSQIVTFNMDEYVNLPEDHPQSYHYFMHQNFFSHINIHPTNVHIPSGDPQSIDQTCRQYEQLIKDEGGLDLQLGGIGSNGHIAFNEPGSSLASLTRVKTLDERTIQDNARFFDRLQDVPRYAITMGVGTIMSARRVVLLASGKNKAGAVADAVEGPITAQCPASAVQMHRMATIIVDSPAAAKLKGHYGSEPAKVVL